jgi:hypothetical protein
MHGFQWVQFYVCQIWNNMIIGSQETRMMGLSLVLSIDRKIFQVGESVALTLSKGSTVSESAALLA